MFPRVLAICLALATAVITAYGYQSSLPDRPWPPEVQKVSNESPPLSPQEALKTFYMPPGYRIELVASEPLIQDPVAIDWDTDGRLWAVEMPGFMANLTGSNELDPIGRVVVLEDVDDDGRMDKRTVFADGMVLARSLKILDRGVLVGEPPNAWLMRDTNGDLRMDTKELVTNQYGRREVDPQNNANGFHWAPDNRMYTAGQADVHLRMKNGALETERTLRRGEWGVTHDDAGRIYRNTNESPVHVDLVPTAYYARHPNLLRTRGSYERLATDNEDLLTVWPVRPNPGTNRAYQVGIDRADGTLARFTAVCAPLVYRGDRLPAELYGNVFVAEAAANLVGRIVLEEDDGGLRARKAYPKGEFLASTDERFRPVFLSNAPDGTLYVVDMYRGIIEHRISITLYLRDQILERKLDGPTGLGRIYRVVHETTRRDPSRALSTATAAQLVDALSHPNGWWRDTAQRLLVERGQSERVQKGFREGSEQVQKGFREGSEQVQTVVPALVRLAATATDWRTRLHALWTLDGIDAIEPTLVAKALADESRDVRVGAVRIAERWLADASHPIHAAFVARAEDAAWQVRQQVAASIGFLPQGSREAAAASLLSRAAHDPVTVDAALSGIRGSETVVLEALLQQSKAESRPNGVEAAVTMLAGTIVRGAQDAIVQNLFASIADRERPAWQRSALLLGAEVALLGVAPPGAAAPRRPAEATTGTLPCPTCPGGRAGPGGAYAFPRPQNSASAGGQGSGRGSGPRLRLNREPALLTTAATTDDEIGRRMTAVLARVSWPGKPGEAASVAPLSAEEQKRFDAGREVYQNLCQACHQPDGRGQDRMAPSLIGSPLALAPATIPTRILLNGKEGPIGLMPPIGSSITDEQIASVLTYIRREWGQEGTPVEPAIVRDVRAIAEKRTRPWTDAELKALAAPDKR
jgi:mono/diheme cytochrome c family protein